MSPRAFPAASVLALALAGGFLLGACGRRGDPLPPGQRLPGAPTALSLSAPDGRLTLSWTAPREDLAGRTVLPLGGYAILRQAWSPEAKTCETCPEDLSQVGTLDSEELRSRRLPETSWTDTDTRPGWTYRYRVRALDGEKRPGPLSSPATVRWTPLPTPAVQAVPGDRQVTLRATASEPEGLASPVFRVYGASGSRLAEAPARTPEFVVPALPNGVAASLSVRIAGRTAEGWDVESPGVLVVVTPLDTTPPFPPTDVVAFAQLDGVELRWLPSGKERYARLVILRAPEAGRFEEIAVLPGDSVSYRDNRVTAGVVYRYTAVAVDEAGNRSVQAREARVSVPEP